MSHLLWYVLTGIIADEEQSKCKENHCPPQNLKELLDKSVLPSPVEGEDERYTHDPNEPGEDEVSHCQAIPPAVVEEVVASSTIVHKDHDCQGEPERSDRFGGN